MPEDALQLRDIHLPPAPSFWPPAPGWWGLAFLLIASLIVSVWMWRKYIQKKRFREHLLTMLDELEYPATEAELPAFLGEISTLLRRLAVLKFGQKRVAKLQGEDWLLFLDAQSTSQKGFAKGAGSLLADGPYLPSKNEGLSIERMAELDELVSLARVWMMNQAGSHS